MYEPMRSYIFAGIAERGAEGYGLYFPDLPGCVTAADTLAELPGNAREALELHLSGMIEDGEAIPAATDIGASGVVLKSCAPVDEEAARGEGFSVSKYWVSSALFRMQ